MRRIKSTGTKLDLRMKELLVKADMPFEMYPKLYGKPDFLVGANIAVFCDSAFWHGRNWNALKKQLESGHNPDYWVNHIAENRARDRTVNRRLRSEGFAVIRFWDSDVYKNPDACVARLGKMVEERSRA